MTTPPVHRGTNWTAIGGIVAFFALGTTLWQAYISKDTENRQLRAYVSPVIVSDHPDDIGRFNLKNFGQTPASQVTVNRAMQELTLGPDGMASLKKKADGLGIVDTTPDKTVFQGDSIQWEIGADSGLQGKHVLWDQSPEKILVTVGHVVYHDVFDKEHETSFCFFQKHNNPVA